MDFEGLRIATAADVAEHLRAFTRTSEYDAHPYAVWRRFAATRRVPIPVRGKRLRFTDGQRRRLAARGKLLGRRALREIGSLVMPDTILRWHRNLVAHVKFHL